MFSLKRCSSTHFALFRMALGAFLASHFASLVPYADEIYGPNGMFSTSVASPFPNLLLALDDSADVAGMLIALASLSVLLVIGLGRRIVAVVLWYGWACFAQRIGYLSIPSEGLVGWLLLFSALAPTGERWSIAPRSRADWAIPPSMIFVVWIVLGVGYLASGFDKLTSPSWQAGTAVRSVLTSPIARWDFVAHVARELPNPWIHGMSWGVVAAEISFLALIWSRWTRPVAWLVMTGFHVVIRCSLRLHTISDPFLVAHFLIFDPNWLREPWKIRSGPRDRDGAPLLTTSPGDGVKGIGSNQGR